MDKAEFKKRLDHITFYTGQVYRDLKSLDEDAELNVEDLLDFLLEISNKLKGLRQDYSKPSWLNKTQ